MVLVFYFQYSKEQMLNILGKTFIIFILLSKNIYSENLIKNFINCKIDCEKEIQLLSTYLNFKIIETKDKTFLNITKDVEFHEAIYDQELGIWNIDNKKFDLIYLDQTFNQDFLIKKNIKINKLYEIFKLKNEEEIQFIQFNYNEKNLFLIKDQFSNLVIYQKKHLTFIIFKYLNFILILMIILYFIYMKFIKRKHYT